MWKKEVRRLWCGLLSLAEVTILPLALVAAQPSQAAQTGGRSASASPRSSAEKLPAVHLDGTYFTAEGKRFVPVGAHWVPAKAAMQWNVEWDPKDIEADFAKMHQLGYSIVRFDVMWPWFEPRPGDYNPTAFQQLDYLVSLAHKYSIYLHPSLFIGGEVGEAYWDVPWRMGRHPHSDPEMLRLETWSARVVRKSAMGRSARTTSRSSWTSSPFIRSLFTHPGSTRMRYFPHVAPTARHSKSRFRRAQVTLR